MAAGHSCQPRACQAFPPRTYGHNSLISSLIQSVFTDGVNSGIADPASHPLRCSTEASTIRTSLLESPWSDLWFCLIVSDTAPLFHSTLKNITKWLVQKGTMSYCHIVCKICVSSSIQNRQTIGVWIEGFAWTVNSPCRSVWIHKRFKIFTYIWPQNWGLQDTKRKIRNKFNLSEIIQTRMNLVIVKQETAGCAWRSADGVRRDRRLISIPTCAHTHTQRVRDCVNQ